LTAVKFDGVYKIADCSLNPISTEDINSDRVVNILDKALIKRELLKPLVGITYSDL
jgi:hypothetical protein